MATFFFFFSPLQSSRLAAAISEFDLLGIVIAIFVVALLILLRFLRGSNNRVYLIGLECYRAPKENRCSIATMVEHAELMDYCYKPETIVFLTKIIERSGVGNESQLSNGIFNLPSDRSLNAIEEEVDMVVFTTVRDVLDKNRINPRNIDFLITNCSLTCLTPSISSKIVNEFGFRSDVRSFNLSGMGCSAGIIAVSLAKDLLKVNNNSIVLILSMEPIGPNLYHGNKKSMHLANCLFRMGGAAILLSNRPDDRSVAKYELRHVIRTHLGADDGAYDCVMQEADDEGNVGVSLARSVVKVAGVALNKNLTRLGIRVLPFLELSRYGFMMMWRKVGRNPKPLVPNFTKAFEHFCIHAGGKAVIEGIKEMLELRESDVEASKMTLHRFGNTSSSSVWYSLQYLETKGRVKRGDRIWQLGFGSGFKCNSAVWKCVSDVDPKNTTAWTDRINIYPVDLIDN